MSKIIAMFHLQGGNGGSTYNAIHLAKILKKLNKKVICLINDNYWYFKVMEEKFDNLAEHLDDLNSLDSVIKKYSDYDYIIVDLPSPYPEVEGIITKIIESSDYFINNVYVTNSSFFRGSKTVINSWMKEMNETINNKKCIGTLLAFQKNSEDERFEEAVAGYFDNLLSYEKVIDYIL